SIIEILAVLYRGHLRLGDGPRAPGRDCLVLSKGHGVMAQYACLRELGWLGDDDVRRYLGDGAALTGRSDAHAPGLEVRSGPLGRGWGVGAGRARGARRAGTGGRVFGVVGAGEANEGAVWEALLFASHFRLSNLTVIIDANGFQAMGRTREVMDMGSFAAKL